MTEREEINRAKYWICCPWCDIPKCVKDTPKCEAEQWAEAKMREIEEELDDKT